MPKGSWKYCTSFRLSRTPAGMAEVKRRRIESKHGMETDERNGTSTTQAEG